MAPQKDTKKDTKIRKNKFRSFFVHSKKSTNFWKLFFLFFEASGRSQTLEIELKRCTVVQKRGSHLFAKNCVFVKKWTINDPPLGPQRRAKTQKNMGKCAWNLEVVFWRPGRSSRGGGWRQWWGPSEGGEASPRSYAEDFVFMSSTPCYL